MRFSEPSQCCGQTICSLYALSESGLSLHIQGEAKIKLLRSNESNHHMQWIQDARAGASTRHATTASKTPGRHKRASHLRIDQVLVDEPTTPPASEVAASNSRDSTPNSRLESLEGALPERVSIPSNSETHLLSGSHSEWEWLQTLYRQNFEVVFGSWMGRYSCPFL